MVPVPPTPLSHSFFFGWGQQLCQITLGGEGSLGAVNVVVVAAAALCSFVSLACDESPLQTLKQKEGATGLGRPSVWFPGLPNLWGALFWATGADLGCPPCENKPGEGGSF